jgi:hypothetical protein
MPITQFASSNIQTAEDLDDVTDPEQPAELPCEAPRALPATLLAYVVADHPHLFIEHRAVRHRAHVVRGLLPELGDRVLVSVLDGMPLVTAVVDGARWRRRAPSPVDAVSLPQGASLEILDAAGNPLASVTRREGGGISLRLAPGDARLEAEGRLELVGESVTLAAREGDVEVSATDHVKVRGETITLN